MRLRIAISASLLIAAALGVTGVSLTAKTTKQTAKKSHAASASAGSTLHRSTKGSATKGGGTKSSGKSSKRSRAREKKGQTTPTPDRISEIQQALGKDGSFSGTPTGKWDDSTVDAMKKFQSSHGLNPSGKLDALTLQKLGLGSQTAGVAAPMRSTVDSSSLTDAPAQTLPRPR